MTIYPLEVHGTQFSGVLIGLRGSPTTLLSPQPLRGGYRTKSSDLLPLFLGSEKRRGMPSQAAHKPRLLFN